MAVSTYTKKSAHRADESVRKEDPRQLAAPELLRLSYASQPAPMSPALREKFEPGFSADFSNIRISRGHIPSELGIEAVSRGTNILLDHDAGMDVLGHELAHVVQQAAGRVPRDGYPVVHNAHLEQEADIQGRQVASGGCVGSGTADYTAIPAMSDACAPAMCKSKETKQEKKAAEAAAEQQKKDEDAAAQAKADKYRRQDAIDARLQSGDTQFRERLAQVDPEALASAEKRMQRTALVKDIEEKAKSGDGHGNEYAENFRQQTGKTLGEYYAKQEKRKKLMAAKGTRESSPSGITKAHRRAYDQRVEHAEDYKAMGKRDRFLWAMKNPAAWLRYETGNGKKDHEERAARQQVLDQRMGDYMAGNSERQNIDFDKHMQQRTVGTGAVDPGGTDFQKSKIPSMGGTLGSLGLGLGGVNPEKIREVVAGTRTLTDSQIGLTSASGMVGMLGNATDIYQNLANVGTRKGLGDSGGTLSESLRTVGNVAKLGGNFTKSIMPLVPSAPIATAMPALNAVGSGFAMAGDLVDMTNASRRRTAMGNRLDSMKDTDVKDMNERDQLTYKIANQTHKAAKIDQQQAITSASGNALNVVGSGLTAGGVTALAGTIIGGVGTGIKMGGDFISDHRRGNLLRSEARDEFDIDKKIEEIRLLYPDMTATEAKQFALKSMGFSSGTRLEAGQALTYQRAKELKTLALAGDKEAIAMLEEMQVGKVESKKRPGGFTYKTRLIGERMGMKGNGSLKQQRQDTIDNFTNPFARKAAASRAEKKKKEQEQQAK